MDSKKNLKRKKRYNSVKRLQRREAALLRWGKSFSPVGTNSAVSSPSLETAVSSPSLETAPLSPMETMDSGVISLFEENVIEDINAHPRDEKTITSSSGTSQQENISNSSIQNDPIIYQCDSEVEQGMLGDSEVVLPSHPSCDVVLDDSNIEFTSNTQQGMLEYGEVDRGVNLSHDVVLDDDCNVEFTSNTQQGILGDGKPDGGAHPSHDVVPNCVDTNLDRLDSSFVSTPCSDLESSFYVPERTLRPACDLGKKVFLCDTAQIQDFIDKINSVTKCTDTPACPGKLVPTDVITHGLGGTLNIKFQCSGCGL